MDNNTYVPSMTKLSRFLCLILRHKPDVIGIELDIHGWADVNELLEGVTKYREPISRERLEWIVKNDEKTR